MTRTRSIVITAGLGLLITLCACGNGPPAGAGGGSGPIVGLAGATLGPAGAKVAANASLQFAPGNITAATGELVQWMVTADSVPHNVTFDSHGTLNSPPTLGPGETWEVKFTVAGTYAYHCTIHAGMNGQVTVTPGAATKAAAGAAGSTTPGGATSPSASPSP
ncbi:MAG TPA: plastocyanin/azurin family copper-binding protein [Candidatus Dormibacteraeota bacterium]|jgi:plastocyanin